MPVLEVRRRGGQIDSHRLSPDSQLLVGQMGSADIVIDDASVQPIHCRFTLRKTGCEVTAATAEGVEFNGKRHVRKAILEHGDTVRLGDVDIVLIFEDRARTDATGPREVIEIEPPSRKPKKEDKESRRDKDAEKVEPVANVFRPTTAAPPAARPAEKSAEDQRQYSSSMEMAINAELERQERLEAQLAPRRPVADESFTSQLKEAMARPRRPGEQELLRSPLVVSLTVGTLALLVITGSLWLILSRTATARKFAEAETALQGGQFTEAIGGFEEFLKLNPGSDRAEEARLMLGRARVEQLLTGAAPDWTRGLDQLNAYLKEYRDRPEWDKGSRPELGSVRDYVVKSAQKVAEGAAQSAGQQGKRPLLIVSADAQKLIERYVPQEKARKLLVDLDATREKAEAAVLKHETFTATLKDMDQSLKQGKTLVAFTQFKTLLLRYPEFNTNRQLQQRLKSILDKEQASGDRKADGPQATKSDRTFPPSLLLMKRTRERSERSSAGESVVVQVDDAVIGLDSITGDPRFRRTVGMVPSFFPLAVPTATPGWLLFDTRHKELLVVSRKDGALQWRLALESLPAGPPLVSEGQIYLALESGELMQIDLSTGAASSRLKFQQKILGPPVISPSAERLYLPGDQSVLYVLIRRPLGIERVMYLGHGAGSIVAPMILMRHYLLVAENDRVDSCKLHLLKIVPEDQLPKEIDTARVGGQVRDPALIYGRDLFVPSIPERVAAFTVTESDDDKSLALSAETQIESPTPSRMFQSAGPDGQLWMASTGLRRFHLSKDGLIADGAAIATGRAIQPLQATGDSLYVARRLPFSRGVFVTHVDRQQMIGEWQATTGAAVLACATSVADKSALAVTSTGEVFRLTPERLATGGFEVQPLGGLNLGDNPTQPLQAATLGDGSVALWSGGAEPKLFHVGGDTAVRTHKLTDPLQTAPIQLGDGWLLPLPGKLRLAFRPTGQPAVQDWLMQIGKQDAPTWRGLVRLDDRHAAAANTRGRVSRVQWNEGEQPHLSEISHWEAEKPVDLAPVMTTAGLVVADTTPRIVLLDPNSLEPRARQPLPGPARRISTSGDRLFIELKGKLLCLNASDQPLQTVFEFPLPASLAGPPIVANGQIVLAQQDGKVLALNEGGKVARTIELPQSLAFGPISSTDLLIVGGADGSVLRIAPMEAGAAP